MLNWLLSLSFVAGMLIAVAVKSKARKHSAEKITDVESSDEAENSEQTAESIPEKSEQA